MIYLTNSGKIKLRKIFSREYGLILDFGENVNKFVGFIKFQEVLDQPEGMSASQPISSTSLSLGGSLGRFCVVY